jgi:two-component system OmpR family response regulator
MKLLLVEDAPRLRAKLVEGLTHLGFVVEEAHDGPAGLWAVEHTRPDVVVLDIMLPGFDGIELLRRMRARNMTTPVLMLTALAEIEDRLKGFDAGADDYLPKPCDLRELAARAQALARRVSPWAQPVIVLGDLEIDPARREVRRGGQPLPMRRRERALLELLAMSRGNAVSRQTIEAKLYADDSDLRSNSIEAAVSQLRRLIDAPGQPSRIVTLRGEGYRLDQ